MVVILDTDWVMVCLGVDGPGHPHHFTYGIILFRDNAIVSGDFFQVLFTPILLISKPQLRLSHYHYK